MAIYKEKRDKNDFRFLALWMLIGNLSNLFIDFFKVDRFGSNNNQGFLFSIGISILFIFSIPLLLIIFDHKIGRRFIDLFYKKERIYTLSGWISITIILIYFVYFTIENIGGGR